MSLNTYRNNLVRQTNEKASLEKRAAQERDKMAKLRKEIFTLQQSITKTSTPSTIRSKQTQILSKEKDLVQSQKNLADTEQKIANKMAEITRTLDSISKAESQEQKKQDADAKKRREAELKHVKDITKETERQRQYASQIQSHRLIIDITRLPDKIKVLFFAANPLDQVPLRLDEEIREITEKVRMSEYRDSIEIISRWAVRPEDLQQALNEVEPQVVHFSGHGDVNGIAFQDDAGNTKWVSIEAITFVMSTTPMNVKVILFNTCLSDELAKALAHHIDIVIGMSDEIGDDAACIFAAQFYSAVGFAKSIKQAFNQAKGRLMLEGIPEENTPQLYCRDGVDPDQIVLVRPTPYPWPLIEENSAF